MSASFRDLQSDILLILSKSKLSKDFRIRERHIRFLINQYRSVAIRDQYKKTFQIEPTWLQDFGKVIFTPINSADDPAIPTTSLNLGKFTIPTPVSLPNDKGVFRVASTSKQKTYYPIEMPRFFELVEGSNRANFCYWFRVGNALYTSPCADQGNVVLILDNPLDGYSFFTENVQTGNLLIGIQYVVTDGQIIHNTIPYIIGQTFVAVNTVFTGNGTVQYVNKKIPRTIDDPYPMSLTMAEFVIIKILTQEFKLEKQEIADIKNDSSDQLTVLQNAQA